MNHGVGLCVQDKSQTRNFADNADVVASLRQIVNGLDNKPGREK